MKTKSTTQQVEEMVLEILEKNPEGVRWVDLNKKIKELNPELHPKTINGTVWKIIEKFPNKVYKPSKGLFRLTKYKN